LELFVDDVGASVAFYGGALGFRIERHDDDYVSMRRGSVILGLGAVAKLPERGTGPGFTRQRLADDKGAGVEIVLELDDRDQVITLHDHCQANAGVIEALQLRPWGLWDFRLVDPDGYYLRVTHGGANDPHGGIG
jgi:catechol 2,3-dioxygenase-like lactoylglutathione lyase family enzyme